MGEYEAMDYKRAIQEMIQALTDERVIRFVYYFLRYAGGRGAE